MVAGFGRRFVGDSIAPYDAGDLVLLAPNVPRCWQAPERRRGEPHEVFTVHFAETFVGQGFFAQPEMRHLRHLLERAVTGIQVLPPTRGTIREAILEMDGAPAWPRIVRMLEILDRIATSPDTKPIIQSRPFNPALGPAAAERLERVCGYIAENYRRKLPQPEAAAVAQMSIPAFSRFFRRATQRTFTAYVNELRVGYACHLLIETREPIADVAQGAGFENLSNFNRRFRQIKGMSPREFRRGYRS